MNTSNDNHRNASMVPSNTSGGSQRCRRNALPAGPRRMVRAFVALCTALSLAGSAIGAQQTGASNTQMQLAALSPRTRVRLWERVGGDLNVPVTGEFAGLSADTVRLVPAGLAAARGIPARDVLRIETSAGPRSAPRLPSAGKGALVGGIGAA